MKGRVPNLDVWEFPRRLETYPDLVRLARIPLFLAMLIALAATPEAMPASRADLIETYLKTLFSPHEHKALPYIETEAPTLRSVAEALAFERLERQEIGASEREVRDVAARFGTDGGSPEAVLGRLLTHGVLRRQSAIRLQFPYPIVQEYLAACHLVRERPETLARRIDDAVQRPWAQVVQFALELHPMPTPIVHSMLEREDDAFATRLRLVGRCIANGAKVDADLRSEVARRLTEVWEHATWRTKERVGRLIVDGFSTPLPPEVRTVLGRRELINYGAGEIVTRANDPALTVEVLTALLERRLDSLMTVRTLQPALNRLGDKALKMYAERARRPGTKDDELDGLAGQIGALDPQGLTPGIALDLALDEALPDKLRLEAFCVTGLPLDDRMWPIVKRALRSDRFGDGWAPKKAIARSPDASEAVLGLLRDPSLTAKQRRNMAENLPTLFPDLQARLAFIRRCVSDSRLPPELRHIMRAFAAADNDRDAFEWLVDRLPTLETDVAGATVVLLGHYPSRELGRRAADHIGARVTGAKEAADFARDAVMGMTTVFEMFSFRIGTLRPSPPHPSIDLWAGLVETWAETSDATEIERLRILVAATNLGSLRATDVLEGSIRGLTDPDDCRFNEEDEGGHHIRAAIDELRRKRRLLPLAVGERFARASRPNVPYAGIAAIAAHADRAALDLLLQLHNDSSERMRDTFSESIETLAGRLGLTVGKVGNVLQLA
jgi:catechol 2,3-dioxygenase-like lactoylglutathione lyase family enzyme